MSKKMSSALIAAIMVVGLMVFSIANAFALEGAEPDGTPLTSAKQLCKELKNNYGQTIKDIKAQAISLQLSKEQVNAMIKDVKAYKKLACSEAKDAQETCKELRKGYKGQVAWAKAKGLSVGLSEDEVESIIADLKMDKKFWCGKATTLTSAVKLCKQAKKTYKQDAENIKAKGLSLQLSEEEIAQQLKDLKTYKNALCKEAKK